MARVIGKIGALKSLKIELNNKGISKFNSLKEIHLFLSNFKLLKGRNY